MIIVPMFFTFILFLILTFVWIDMKKNRRFIKYPKTSFIIPCYNNEKTISDTITKIFDSYPKELIEMFVVNDKSTDNSLEVMKECQSKFNFKIINNTINLGKSNSVNKAFKQTTSDFVFVIDADAIVNTKGFQDAIAHFEYDEKVGGVSCRFKIKGNSFLARMVGLEYNMLALTNQAYNLTSTLSMWGACLMFRKKAFEQIGGLKSNMITEDMDSCLNLQEHGWKTRQVFCAFETYAPENLSSWAEQKYRWASGGMQCFLKHTKIYLKNPLSLFFMFSYSVMGITLIWHFFNWNFVGWYPTLLMWLFYSTLSLPYAIMDIKEISEITQSFWVLAYTLVYYPVFMMVSVFGLLNGIQKYLVLDKEARGW